LLRLQQAAPAGAPSAHQVKKTSKKKTEKRSRESAPAGQAADANGTDEDDHCVGTSSSGRKRFKPGKFL
jgi:hypothetical protein